MSMSLSPIFTETAYMYTCICTTYSFCVYVTMCVYMYLNFQSHQLERRNIGNVYVQSIDICI